MTRTTHFFLGVNSGRGFQSLYDRFCEPQNFHDLAIIKGGPGGGKSTLMRRVGQAMERRGEQVEYLHCSGDPESLDGVHIPRLHAAVVDGTAPHVLEPRYPGAVERYLDLGVYCDPAVARKARHEIIRRTKENSAAYQRAYRALAAARQVEEAGELLAREGLDSGKLLRRTEGIIGREIHSKGGGGVDAYRYIGSVTCLGPVWRFDSVPELCPKVYELQDAYGLAAPMLDRLHEAASARGISAIVCPSPERMDRIEHLLLPELGTAFVTSREGMKYSGPVYRRVRVDALIAPSHLKRNKSRLKFLRRMAAELREEGMTALRDAKAAHDALEAAYRPSIDIEGLNECAQREIQRLESYI